MLLSMKRFVQRLRGVSHAESEIIHPRSANLSSIPDDIVDRGRGAFVGLFVGDSLGSTLEFSRRDSLPRQTEMTGGGPFSLQPGQWTDDGSTAYALGRSLLDMGEFDGHNVMTRFLAWRNSGEYSPTGCCIDIGNTVAKALKRFEWTGSLVSPVEESDAGNGSLMRLVPVVLHAIHDAEKVRRLAAAQSLLTHGAPQATEACTWFAERLRRAVIGEDRAAVLVVELWRGHPAMQALVAGRWKHQSRNQIKSTGYVIDTLEAALWAVEQTTSFEDALVLAVNLGNDSDTVGAVTGQLAGALYGLSGIPHKWLAPLAWRGDLIKMADGLLCQAVR